jgi:hypothetical protein
VVSHFHPFRSWSAELDKNATGISNLLMQHHVVNCYDNAPSTNFYYYYPALEFYYAQKRMNIDISMAAQNSLRYKAFSPLNKYDCIVDSLTANDSSYIKDYEIIYNDANEKLKLLLRKGK